MSELADKPKAAQQIRWALRGRTGGETRRRSSWPRHAWILEALEARVLPSLLGQQLFPSNYPWNQNIAAAPVAPNSAAIIAQIGSHPVHPDWGEDNPANGSSPLYGIPINIVHGNSTATVNVIINTYPGESDIVAAPIPANPVIEGDYQDGPNLNGPGYGKIQRGDSHLIIWDEDNNIAYEFYEASRPNDAATATGGPTDNEWQAAQETVWNMNTDEFRTLGYTSADAAGLSILAGLARPDEGLPVSDGGQGAIDHALRFTLPAADVNPQFIYPASHEVNVSSQSSTSLPMGARLRLKNTQAIDSLISSMGPEAQIIATAMQQYGLVLADVGSPMFVTGTSASVDANNNISLVWNMDDVFGLRSLTTNDFQVVDLTPQVTSLSASTGSAGNTITIIGQNFSGAAGNLSVFFGGTASKLVTYIDDSHITALVPPGSGTGDVTVQSGVYEIDSDNPGANVTAPIFGYGTSTTSSADLFTYVAQTPQLSQVAVNGSTAPILSAVVSGGTVTITTDGASGFAAGQLVLIAGVDGSAASGFDGPFTIAGTAGNSFTYTDANASGSAADTGTATTRAASGLLTNAADHSNLDSQRSMVDSIVYSFNEAVNFAVNAVSITAVGQGGQTPTLSYGTPDGGDTWVITFSGNGVVGNSIANGEYQIALNGAAVTAVTGGAALAANDIETFYRLYGDTVGNGHDRVNTTDTNAFLGAFNSRSTAATFLAFLDLFDDGRINTADTNIFLGDFNTRFSGFTATI